jgi:biotin synthase
VLLALEEILRKRSFDRRDVVELLSATAPDKIELIRARAEKVLLTEGTGAAVFFRGLIEFSNVCVNDCDYCGIRRSNGHVRRYTLSEEEIAGAARWCDEQGYGSVVLQSGERRDEEFVSFVERVVRRIKAESRSERLPDGLGVTLSLGEQEPEAYRRFFDAGAHRYLLRIETTSPDLYKRIHPPRQTLRRRTACLASLKEIGFQVGTGVMIGLPGQTVGDLADDILFFRDRDVDMIGMGPYIVHRDTPMSVYEQEIGARRAEILRRSLLMIAAARIVLRNVNIAATTALQAIDPTGREEGLRFGANVIMPQATPLRVRRDYLLYEGKPCLDETPDHCRGCLTMRIESVGRKAALGAWGDPLHFSIRKNGGAA